MRKTNLSYKSRHFNNVKSKKRLVARSKQKKGGRAFGYNSSYNLVNNANNHVSLKTFIVPKNLSMIDNMDEFMRFLGKMNVQAYRGNNVLIDFSRVEAIKPDGLLMMLAYLNLYKTKHPDSKIMGNKPHDDYCRQVINESGIFRYVSSNESHENMNILSIRSGTKIRANEAGAVVQFVRKMFGITDMSLTKAVYTTIMEVMTNVSEHAYSNSNDENNYGWWLMALPAKGKETEIVHFALVDNGYGIPNTIRRKFAERLMVRDETLIQAAVLESNRSSTNLPYRGKGLPKLGNLVRDNKIRNLYFISRQGGYLVDENMPFSLNGKEYYGTMVSWDFIKE